MGGSEVERKINDKKGENERTSEREELRDREEVTQGLLYRFWLSSCGEVTQDASGFSSILWDFSAVRISRSNIQYILYSKSNTYIMYTFGSKERPNIHLHFYEQLTDVKCRKVCRSRLRDGLLVAKMFKFEFFHL